MSLDRLAAKIAAVPLNGRGHRRYPDSLKREITAAHASSGMTRKVFSDRIGLPEPSLYHWRDLYPAQESSGVAAKFKSVTVETERHGALLSVRAPGGVTINGLTIETVAELLAVLAARSAC